MSEKLDKDKLLHLYKMVDEKKDELIRLSCDLISYPSVCPPGRNCGPVQDFIQGYLEELGCSIDRWEYFKGDPNIVAVLPGTDSANYKSLILNNHVDVAEVGDVSQWSFDPFKPFVKDGRLYGRGASDMKTALAACLFTMKLLKEADVGLKGDLILHSVTGEEVGEGITRQCVESGPRGDFAIAADISDFEILGQGGVITGWITVESPTTFHDGVRARMIHAGGGIFGASAVEKMSKVIQGLQDLERHWAVMKQYEGFPPGSNTINPAVIEGGRHAAFVADKCSLWITVHFYPDEDYKDVSKEIEEHIMNVAAGDPWLRDNPPKFRWGGESMIEDRGEIFPSLELDREHEGTKLLADVHHAVTGEKPIMGMSPTVTDAGWLGEGGIPTVLYGPGELALAHAVDESIDLEDLISYTKVLIEFATRWCNTPK
ncbi:MAG: acetylornithine deacetylase [Clostridia bacterium]|nr:acetylornithine deacetylase [Clostridia bacterium]